MSVFDRGWRCRVRRIRSVAQLACSDHQVEPLRATLCPGTVPLLFHVTFRAHCFAPSDARVCDLRVERAYQHAIALELPSMLVAFVDCFAAIHNRCHFAVSASVQWLPSPRRVRVLFVSPLCVLAHPGKGHFLRHRPPSHSIAWRRVLRTDSP